MKKSRDQTSLQRKEASLMVAIPTVLTLTPLEDRANTSFKDWICTLTHRLLKSVEAIQCSIFSASSPR